MARISRRQLSQYAAQKIHAGTETRHVLAELAAFLVDTRRIREADLLVRDIEEALAQRGTVIADVTSAHKLSETIKRELAYLVEAKDFHVRETVDPTLLGGILVDVPGKRLDGTLRRKLTLLKAKQL